MSVHKNKLITKRHVWGLPKVSMSGKTGYDFSGKPLYTISIPEDGATIYPDIYSKYPVPMWLSGGNKVE